MEKPVAVDAQLDKSSAAQSSMQPISTPPRPPSTSSQDSEGDSGDNSAKPTRKPMKNVSRERMKAETKFLRDRVLELERELSTALAKKALDRCNTPSPVWRDLAKRQAARREKSEEERDRLRAKLLYQLQVAKSLEGILRNRSGAFLDDLCASAAARGHKTYPVENLALLHDQLTDEIDQLFPLVDTLFAEPITPQDAMESSQRRSTVVSQHAEGDKTVFVELRNTVYVPFAYDRVCNAIWRAITTEYRRQERLVEEYCCTADEYTCSFTTYMHSHGGNVPHMSGMVMRKFTEANRVVIMWRSVDWDLHTPTKPGYGDDTGWIVVMPAVDAATGERYCEGTTVRVCTRCVPIWEAQAMLIEAGALQTSSVQEEALTTQNLQVGEVTNRILNATEDDIAAITESIENILLGELIGPGDHNDQDDLDGLMGNLLALPPPLLDHQDTNSNVRFTLEP